MYIFFNILDYVSVKKLYILLRGIIILFKKNLKNGKGLYFLKAFILVEPTRVQILPGSCCPKIPPP